MAFTEVDEKVLVRAYQAGDERAFDTIVRTQYNALYAHALRRLTSRESAEDAVQDTLLRAYRALPNLDGDLALRAWLHRILTNVCHDEGNRRRREQGLVERVGALPEEIGDDPAEEAVLHDTVRVMAEALKDLPESYREALVLRYVDGLSFREVAEATGVTEENARARVHRGRNALHKLLARVALAAAFVIPGLRRTPHATTGAEQAAASGTTDTATLLTQLTSHAVNHGPAAARLVEAASMTSGTKSALVTTAVAAVAAVGVTGGAVVVNEVRTPDRPPPVAAAPLAQPSAGAGAATAVGAGAGTTTTTPSGTSSPSSSTTTSSSTLPASAVAPFETPGTGAAASPSSSTSTTSTTSTTIPPQQTVTATVEGQKLGATGDAPNVDVAGAVTVRGDTPRRAQLSGRLTLHDDGFASAELTLAVDGKRYAFSYRGSIVERTSRGGVTAWKLAGKYRLVGGAALGVPESGDLAGLFQRNGELAELAVELVGVPAEDASAGGAAAGQQESTTTSTTTTSTTAPPASAAGTDDGSDAEGAR